MTTTDQTTHDVIMERLCADPDLSAFDAAQEAAEIIDALTAAGYAVVPAAEVEMLRRGGKELGRMVKRLSDDHLAAIGEKPGGDLIDTDGDGHWDEVWDRLMALRPERDAARTEVERLRAQIAAVQALHHSDEWVECVECSTIGVVGVPWPCSTIRALDGEATDG